MFNSLLPILDYSIDINNNLRGRGIDKISRSITKIIQNSIEKKEIVLQHYTQISGVSCLSYLKCTSNANKRRTTQHFLAYVDSANQ